MQYFRLKETRPIKSLCLLILGLGLLWTWSGAALATPALQLYFDPTDNPGAAYDAIDEGWETDVNPAVLSAFINPDQAVKSDHTFRVIFSLPNVSQADDPNGSNSINVTDATTNPIASLATAGLSPWVFGNPGLQPHGIFDAWYSFFDFMVDDDPTGGDNSATIFNVQDGTGSTSGFRADFGLSFNGPDTLVHTDLVDLDTGFTGGGLYQNFAPISHDAQWNPDPPGGGNPTPEPGTVILFGVGLLLLLGVGMRKKRSSNMPDLYM